VGHGLLIHEVSRPHTTTHHSRQDSSGRVISLSQRPLPDNTQHSQQTNSHAPVGFEPTISAGERPQTYALDQSATDNTDHQGSNFYSDPPCTYQRNTCAVPPSVTFTPVSYGDTNPCPMKSSRILSAFEQVAESAYDLLRFSLSVILSTSVTLAPIYRFLWNMILETLVNNCQ
jgi:hypothetical protein